MSEWRPIETHIGIYEVSIFGEVRSTKGRILKQWSSDQGYMLVRLSSPRVVARVHRLVATAFISNERGFPVVNHIDCVRSNNNCSNLEWCTQQDNIKHSENLGRMQRDYWCGRRSPNAHLDNSKVSEIREIYAMGGISMQSLGDRFGVSKRSIGRIINGESYV